MIEIPPQIKNDNWAFHVLARSDDVAIKCLNTVNLIANLKTTMQIAGITMHDSVLQEAERIADLAWYQYSGEKNPGRAAQTCKEAYKKILFLVYNPEYCTPQRNSFTGRGE